MPYLTEFINGGTGILRTGEGIVTGQEIIEALKAFRDTVTTPERITHGLVDLSRTTKLEISSAELKRIAEIDRGAACLMKIERVAIVASTDLSFGLARMYEAWIAETGWELKIFRDIEPALEWLACYQPA